MICIVLAMYLFLSSHESFKMSQQDQDKFCGECITYCMETFNCYPGLCPQFKNQMKVCFQNKSFDGKNCDNTCKTF